MNFKQIFEVFDIHPSQKTSNFGIDLAHDPDAGIF